MSRISNDAETIKALYEDSELTPEEIAESLGVHPSVVRLVLKGSSEKYTATDAKADVTDAEFEAVKEATKQIAFDKDQAAFLRAQMLKFLWNEKKGRNDAKVGQVAANMNILILNEKLSSVVSRKQAALESPAQPIELPAQP